MTPEETPAPGRATTFVADVGAVVLVWIVILVAENLLIGLGWREQFAGSWEMAHARHYVSPIAIAVMLPLAVLVVALGRLVAARQVRAVGVVGGLLGILVAIGVSSGRHFESLALRAPFVAMGGLTAGGAAALLTRRAPLARPRLLAGVGAVVAAGAWLADGLVLPRLYPAFHAALLVLVLAAWATTALLIHRQRAWRPVALVTVGLAVVAALAAPRCARALVGDDNLRRVLVEHAPVLGRAVLLAARIAPAPALDEDAETLTTAALVRPAGSPRALDWTGRDIVVVTIDALRADHVSSYGYGRRTTPNIDRLAARGTRFEHAYCPTPHTSYSVTSMMTGKYMRPLLALETGEDSETWAHYLRRYDFRTAAFYPPAVFFIDEHRFRRMKEEGLGFEYRKEEFAAPELRRTQIASYVASAPTDKPLFLWVHLFEPHEPYVQHPEHSFGESTIDAYDSEVATADAVVGEIVDVVEKRRPGAVFVVSADHGEEFGEHGGRYHGTTVYEEQVRVPLVIVAPGVPTGVVTMPVQTIDLLPTTLAALDVPQPARVRGRDLGAVLAGKAAPGDPGLAFAETDDYTLLARGDERLVCVRKIASCTLFDVRNDPLEKRPIADRPARVQELRRLTAAIERENGKLEAPALPEALRRGLQGDRDAAEDVAALFDDARADIRREAARCAFKLRAPAMAPQLRRALARDEDAAVKHWSALALLRQGEGGVAPPAEALLHDADPRLRLAAALVLGEHGDSRGEAELVARWNAAFVPGARQPGDLEEAREILAALARLKAHGATSALVRSLEDVRLRPYVVETLGQIGDPRAQAPLLAAFLNERYVDVRPKEARALLRLGTREPLLGPLRKFAGVPDPMLEAVAIAREAGLLEASQGGWTIAAATLPSSSHVDAEVTVAGTGAARLLAIGLGDGPVTGRVDGAAVSPQAHGTVWTVELPAVSARTRIELEDVAAFWVVRRAEEIPPPPPREWSPAPHDGGTESGL